MSKDLNRFQVNDVVRIHWPQHKSHGDTGRIVNMTSREHSESLCLVRMLTGRHRKECVNFKLKRFISISIPTERPEIKPLSLINGEFISIETGERS